MDVYTLMLIGAALLPALILCIYVFKKDRVEKEPIGLLLKLLLFGALICFPVVYVETVVGDLIDAKFSAQYGTDHLSQNAFYIYINRKSPQKPPSKKKNKFFENFF